MSQDDLLSGKIGELVDHLRQSKSFENNLTNIASVTEVLISIMQSYFKSIDTSIYRECRSLSEYISNARIEIASLSPSDEENDRIPRAGLELDAIVQATEEATNTIMNSAEEILTHLGEDDINPHKESIETSVMKIFEACSFQDITGQRISKVVETLAHIENRVAELRNLMGVTEDQIQEAKKKDAEEAMEAKHDPLARGPSLAAEGIGQDDVDAMFDSDGSGSADAPAIEEEENSDKSDGSSDDKDDRSSDSDQSDSDSDSSDDESEPLAAASNDEADAPEPEQSAADDKKDKKKEEVPSSEEVNQDEIDALFN